MVIGSIDFPREVLKAQRDGNLVVFAGAGVSMGPPSSLPSFAGLADQIGFGNSPRKESETFDAYLGRLADGGSGVKIHEAAVEILLRPGGRPTDLHRSLLRLFEKGQGIRLVTTNFDNHFVTAANDLGLTPRVFNGPALPLGGDFEGIIHLHGALQGPPKELILTDVDFGAAYLTEAWASRFLYQMFLTYTVLFVGYSHEDVVMNYVAKGISTSRSQPKFILTDNRETVWRLLGISPIHFTLVDGPWPYSALPDAIGRWADEIQRGLHEKAERIRTIVEAAPPVDGEEADYLLESLMSVETARHFAKFAKIAEYIRWVENNGLLKALFQNDRKLSEAEEEIAYWYISHCIPSHHRDALAAFQRGGNRLNSWVSLRICHLLTYNRDKFDSAASFSAWVKILLNQSHDSLQFHHWEELLNSCLWPEDEDVAILLLDRCLQPHFLTKKSWLFSSDPEKLEREERVEEHVNLSEDRPHYLGEFWDRVFKPNLSILAPRLFSLLIANLEKVYLLLHQHTIECSFDSISVARRRIRGYGYTSSSEVIDVLVDATRDVLEQLMSDQPGDAGAFIATCFRSPSSLLKRIAVHGVETNLRMSPDEKINWVLTNSLVFNYEGKADIFSLLRSSFPLATEQIRRKLVDFAMRNLAETDGDDTPAEIGPYAVYNLLHWLQLSLPDCGLVAKAIVSVQEAHPDFRPRENPELNMWLIDEGDDETSIPPEQPGVPAPEELIESILAQLRQNGKTFDFRERAYSISGLVAQDPEWGFDAQRYIVSQNLTERPIWNALYNGWRDAPLKGDLWIRWLEAQGRMPDLIYAAEGIAEVLETASRRKENALPDSVMGKAFLLSVSVYESLKLTPPILPKESEDWLGIAINRAGGDLAQFWLQYLSQIRSDSGETWAGLPEKIRSLFRDIASNESDTGSLARVVLVSQFHYLFFTDQVFAKDTFLPLLDWSKNKSTAVQCWQGYLGWGQWKKSFLPLILPLYNQTLEHLLAFGDRTRESFASHIAAIAVYGFDNPLTDGWLYSVISRFDSPLRGRFARTTRKVLEGMAPETAMDLWVRWLKQYWEARLVNRAGALSGREMSEMLRWPLHLDAHFPEAVSLLVRSPASDLAPVNISKDIPASFFGKFPNAVGEYIAVLLGSSRGGHGQANDVRKHLPELKEAGLSFSVEQKLLDLLAKFP